MLRSWRMDPTTAAGPPAHLLRRNLTLLYAFRGLTAALVVVPVIVPYWQSRGLSQTQIFLLQSAFGLSMVLFEVPSGWFADRFGRRTSLLVGSVLPPLGFALYAVSPGFAGMVVAEVILGLGLSFISGADAALAYDSLLSIGEEAGYRRFEARTFTWTGLAEAGASVVGGALAVISLLTPVIVQAGVYSLLFPLALLMTEPPRQAVSAGRDLVGDVVRVTKYALHGHAEVKWFIFYAAVIGTLTHTMVWLIQPYYQQAGVPLGWFGVLWAVQMAALAVFARYGERYEIWLGRRRALVWLLVLGCGAYAVLATATVWWLLPVILVFYFVRAVQTPLLNDYVNSLVDSGIRATVLSVKTLAQRALYVVLGPVIGAVMDAYSLRAALLFSAVVYAVLGVVVVAGMVRARVL